MPLVKPALAALAIFVFLGNWTAFLWPLIVTNSVDMYTIPVGLSGFGDEADVAVGTDHDRRRHQHDPDP